MKTAVWIRIMAVAFSAALFLLLGTVCFYIPRFWCLPSGELRIPLEQKPLFSPPELTSAPLETALEKGTASPSTAVKASWSQFRGDLRDGICKDHTPLSFETPKRLWEQAIGAGYAGAAIRNGCVYLIDHDEKLARDVVRCLSLDDGKDVWRFSWPVKILSDHGFTRTVPAVSDHYCVGMGPKGHVFCVDAKSGEKKWMIDLVARYKTVIPNWYAGQCVLLETSQDGKETAIVAPAGEHVLLAAIDCETGQEVWTTRNPFKWKMTHSSVVRMTLDSKPTYLYCGSDGVCGIDAQTGKLLWGTSVWKIVQATCPSPVVLPNNRVFLCGGYGAGSVLLEIFRGNDGKYHSKVLNRLKESQFGSTQQTPIWYKGRLWGVGRGAGKFCCLDAEANVSWRSRTKTNFGDGPYIIADDRILALNDNGLLIVAKANPDRWSPEKEIQIIEGHECWGPMALANGRLVLRSLDKIICVDISGKGAKP
ncbi:MAG: PQQ-like beta-propeller repeat protein [Thermoguttaceae bacterium]|nr:PQQ-like beta-propeller repeat protein [Thermoguttaceae bacterium]